MARLVKIEVYPAAGSSRIVVEGSDNLLDFAESYPTVHRELGKVDDLSITHRPASPWQGQVKSRMRLKALYEGGTFEEWRVTEVQYSTAGRSGMTVKAVSIWADLSDRIMKRWTPLGEVTTGVTLMGLTTANVLAAVLSDEWDCPPAFRPGTVATRYLGAVPIVQGRGILHLEALRQLCEQLSCEWQCRWDGQVYRIDLVERIGSRNAAMRVIEAPTAGEAPSKANRLDLTVVDTGEAYFNRILPLMGEAEYPTTISGAYWRCSSATYATGRTTLNIQYDPLPVVEDGLLNGLRIGTAETGYFLILESRVPDTIVVEGSATALAGKHVRFVSADKKDLLYLELPGSGGTREISERFDDIPLDHNILKEQGISADMSDGSSIPTGWSLAGGASGQMVTEPMVAYGTKAFKVTAQKGGGVETRPIALTPTSKSPYYSFWSRVTVSSGRVTMYLEDSTAACYPPPGVINYGTDAPAEIETTGQGIEPAAGDARLRIVALTDNCEFYVDAVTLTQSTVPSPYSESMGPRALFVAGAKRLVSVGGASPLSYESEFIDVAVLESSGTEVGLGDMVTVRDDYKNGSWNVNLEARVVELQIDEDPMLGRVRKRVRLERKQEDVAARFIEAPAVPREQAAPQKPQTLDLDALNVTVATDKIATIARDTEGMTSRLELGEPLRIDLRAGTELILVGQYSLGNKTAEHGYVTVSEECYQGGTVIPIQLAYVRAVAGQPVQLDHAAMMAYLYVRPASIQMGVEENRRQRSLTRLTSAVSGYVARLLTEPLMDRLPKDAVLQVTDVRHGSVQTVIASRDHQKGERVLDIYGQDLTCDKDSAIDIAGHYVGSQLLVTRDEITARVRSDQVAATWQKEAETKAFAKLTAAANGKALAVTALTSPLKAGAKTTLIWLDSTSMGFFGIPYVASAEAVLTENAAVGATALNVDRTIIAPKDALLTFTDGEMLARFTSNEAAITVLSDQVTQYASSVTTLGTDLGDLSKQYDAMGERIGTAEGRITTAEGRITTMDTAINQRVTKAEFTDAMLGAVVGTVKTDLTGLTTRIALTAGAAFEVKANTIVMIVDKDTRQVGYARVQYVVAKDALYIDVVDAIDPTQTLLLYAKAGSNIMPFLTEPELLRTSLNIGLDGIDVEARLFKTSDWDGVVDEVGKITQRGSKGWAITASGNAEFNDVDIRGSLTVPAGHGLYSDNFSVTPAGVVQATNLQVFSYMEGRNRGGVILYKHGLHPEDLVDTDGNPTGNASNWWILFHDVVTDENYMFNDGSLVMNYRGGNSFRFLTDGRIHATGEKHYLWSTWGADKAQTAPISQTHVLELEIEGQLFRIPAQKVQLVSQPLPV